MMAEDGTAAEERAQTKRVVLKREHVIVLPEGFEQRVDPAKLADALGLPKAAAAKLLPSVEAWIVVGEFEGGSKTKAIEAYAGKPGTPDAKVGAYRAPSTSAWSGGEVYEAPPEPLVTRKALD